MDEGAAIIFQERYLAGERGAISGLYAEFRFMARAYILAIYGRGHIWRSEVEVDELAHEIASRIIIRYTTTPGYRYEHPRYLAYLETRHALTTGNHNQERFDRRVIPLHGQENLPAPEKETSVPREGWLDEILASDSFGRRAVLSLRSSTSFRGSMRDIASYCTRQWIYDHGAQLHYIWRMIKREKELHGIPGHNGSRRGKKGGKSIWTQLIARSRTAPKSVQSDTREQGR